jgi:cysteinyl-tRNA synthetase
LDAARENYRNIIGALRRHRTAINQTDKKVLADLHQAFTDAINNDLNTPVALAVLHQALKQPESPDIYDLITKDFDRVLDLSLVTATNAEEPATTIPAEITALAEQRLTAKKNRDWSTADKLRAEIIAAGYQINDTPDGYTLSKN